MIPPPDAFAHFPFFPEERSALTAGSFLGAATEDGLVAIVWRLRRWNLSGTLSWVPGPGSGFTDPIEVFNSGGPGYIINGESNQFLAETGPFVDLSDILQNWRKTRSMASGVNGVTTSMDIFWGPRGAYDISGATDIGGVLDSEIICQFDIGDDVSFMGTQEGRVVESGNTLANGSGIDFVFTDTDGVSRPVPLFFDDIALGGDPFTSNWTGTLRMAPGDLWWSWRISNDPTWDVGTGAQLSDPLRKRINGEPAYLCQQD